MVAPLDWGLGHATRCIPLIRYVSEKGCKVTIAGEGQVKALMEREFPGMEILPLKGYRIYYPKKGWMFVAKIILQLPKIILAVQHERNWLKKQAGNWDLVISDNRYGLCAPNTPCVLITHQLAPVSGLGNWADKLLSTFLNRWIYRFHSCWIPDEANDVGIAGVLSHPAILPVKSRYIGPLSRMQYKKTEQKGHILVILSGPEPQRSLLENILIRELELLDEEVVFVRGLPTPATVPDSVKRIRFENHLDAGALEAAMAEAELVVCRSGYSSVMDLLAMRKKAVLIPTPGQTEQLYIASHLEKRGWFVVQQQETLQLRQGIAKTRSLSPDLLPHFHFEGFKQAFSDLGI